MLDCSMAPSAYVPILVLRERVMLDNALMAALETIQSRCAEGLDTSTFSTLMPTKQQLMIGAVATRCKIPTTKNGTMTWDIVVLLLVSHYKGHTKVVLIFRVPPIAISF